MALSRIKNDSRSDAPGAVSGEANVRLRSREFERLDLRDPFWSAN